MSDVLALRAAEGLAAARGRIARAGRLPIALTELATFAGATRDRLAALTDDADPSGAIDALLGGAERSDAATATDTPSPRRAAGAVIPAPAGTAFARGSRPSTARADVPTGDAAADRGGRRAPGSPAGTVGADADLVLAEIAAAGRATPLRVVRSGTASPRFDRFAASASDRGTSSTNAVSVPHRVERDAQLPRPSARDLHLSRSQPEAGSGWTEHDWRAHERRRAALESHGPRGLAELAEQWSSANDDDPLVVDWSSGDGIATAIRSVENRDTGLIGHGPGRGSGRALDRGIDRAIGIAPVRTGTHAPDPDARHADGSRAADIDAELRLRRTFRGLLEDALLGEALADGIEVTP